MNENAEQVDEQRPSAPLCSWERADELIGVVCLVLIVVSIVWGVLTRYILERSASWSFELAVIAFGWMVFFGTAAGVRYRMHADIDALVARFPPAVRKAVAIFNWLLLAALFLGLTILFTSQAIVAHTILTVAMSLPRSVVYGPMAIASAAILYQHLKLHPWRPGALDESSAEVLI
jgi:TRAP-type C4-dicarboxylate transport system permease small subunit